MKDYKIRPKKIRIGDSTLQGYERESFQAAFARYIPTPPDLSGTPEQISEYKDLHKNLSGTSSMFVPDKNHDNPLKGMECSGVPDKTWGSARAEVYPTGFTDALAAAASGLNVTPAQVAGELYTPADRRDFIEHPEMARSIAEDIAYRK